MPVEVVTEGVSVIVDVPDGVPATCGTGVGMVCGLTLAAPPPQPAVSKRQSVARTITAAAGVKRAIGFKACSLKSWRNSARAKQHANSESTRSQVNGGSWTGTTISVLFVVATLTT